MHDAQDQLLSIQAILTSLATDCSKFEVVYGYWIVSTCGRQTSNATITTHGKLEHFMMWCSESLKCRTVTDSQLGKMSSVENIE